MDKCSMCSLHIRRDLLMGHIIAFHKDEPAFKVYCNQPSCGASYTKWESFRKHVQRKHKGVNFNPNNDVEVEDNNHDHGSDDMETEDVNNEVNVYQGPEMSLNELREWQAVMLTSKLQEQHLIPETTVQDIVQTVDQMVHNRISSLQAAIKQEIGHVGDPNIPVERINKTFQEALNSDPFQSVNSSYLRNKYLENNCMLVNPKEVKLGKIKSWSLEGKLIEADAVGYTVPFLQDLKTLLNNNDILHCVENPRPYKPGLYSSVLDGSIYRSHKNFELDSKAISVILYYDDVEYCNLVGSKKRKIAMFYYIIGNIYPELRSTTRAINLLAIVDSKHLKRFGVEPLLKSFLEDLKKLSEGVIFTIRNERKKFSGFLHFIVGDTPASNYLGGFKEGVGGALHPCRTCFIVREDLGNILTEVDTLLRDMETHAKHVAAITTPNLRPSNRVKWSKWYGVNDVSCFARLDGFDVTKAFPHDFMHVVVEGTLEAQCRLFIKHCLEKGLFNLSDLNNAIASFQYGHLVKDKPSAIEAQHLQSGLKQSAAQMLALGFSLPFFVFQWLNDSVDDNVHNLITLLQIINLSLSFVIMSDDIALLTKMIQVYIASFIQLYPDAPKTPKLHYMVHLPHQIVKYGPLRQQWCFRFEACHQYFKNLACRVKIFRNLPYTFSRRRQTLKCVQLASPRNMGVKPFLYLGDDVRAGKPVNVRDHEHRDVLLTNIPLDSSCMVSPQVVVHGTTYKKGSVILLADPEDSYPLFGQIDEVVVFDQKIYLLYVELKTVLFEECLNAYQVVKKRPFIFKLISVSELLHPHSLSVFKCLSKQFVILSYYRRSEFAG